MPSSEVPDTAARAQLRRNSLGLTDLIFHGITHIAPATNVVFTFPIIAAKAGPAMPISFLLTTIVCLFIANTVAEFSRYMPSSGGYYSLRDPWPRKPHGIYRDLELSHLRHPGSCRF